MFAACVILILFGVSLLVLGVRGRRFGTTPHCRRCGYNLTGLVSNRCPECGTHLTALNTVRGLRRRRIPAIWLGVILLALGAAGAYRGYKALDWYAVCPLRGLLVLARNADTAALNEISRRCRAQELSKSQIDYLAKECLNRYAEARRSESLAPWFDVLATIDTVGGLTPEQQRRYYDQMIGESLIQSEKRIAQVSPSQPIPLFQLCPPPNCTFVRLAWPSAAGWPLFEATLQIVRSTDGAWVVLHSVPVRFSSFLVDCHSAFIYP